MRGIWFTLLRFMCGFGVLCLWYGAISVYANDDVARAWTTFRQEDGLAHNVVTSVAQTPDGAMWFATFDGISRYDGRTWQTFTTQSGLPSNMVWDLAVEANGVVWAAMGGGFTNDVKQAIARYANGKWQGLDTPEDLFGRFGVRKFFASSPNTGCLVTDDGRLLLLDNGALHLVRGIDGEILRGVQSVLYTAEGQLWIAYGYGQRSMFRFGGGDRVEGQVSKALVLWM
jgi:ligand-binding sensor domain-containing protein